MDATRHRLDTERNRRWLKARFSEAGLRCVWSLLHDSEKAGLSGYRLRKVLADSHRFPELRQNDRALALHFMYRQVDGSRALLVMAFSFWRMTMDACAFGRRARKSIAEPLTEHFKKITEKLLR